MFQRRTDTESSSHTYLRQSVEVVPSLALLHHGRDRCSYDVHRQVPFLQNTLRLSEMQAMSRRKFASVKSSMNVETIRMSANNNRSRVKKGSHVRNEQQHTCNT